MHMMMNGTAFPLGPSSVQIIIEFILCLIIVLNNQTKTVWLLTAELRR